MTLTSSFCWVNFGYRVANRKYTAKKQDISKHFGLKPCNLPFAGIFFVSMFNQTQSNKVRSIIYAVLACMPIVLILRSIISYLKFTVFLFLPQHLNMADIRGGNLWYLSFYLCKKRKCDDQHVWFVYLTYCVESWSIVSMNI